MDNGFVKDFGDAPAYPTDQGHRGINRLTYMSTEFMKAFLTEDPNGHMDVMADRAIAAANILIKKLNNVDYSGK